jgi:hypothetical protein
MLEVLALCAPRLSAEQSFLHSDSWRDCKDIGPHPEFHTGKPLMDFTLLDGQFGRLSRLGVQAMGIEVPATLIVRADEVIESCGAAVSYGSSAPMLPGASLVRFTLETGHHTPLSDR